MLAYIPYMDPMGIWSLKGTTAPGFSGASCGDLHGMTTTGTIVGRSHTDGLLIRLLKKRRNPPAITRCNGTPHR